MLNAILVPVTAFSILAMQQANSLKWGPDERVLSSHQISLEQRYPVTSVNQVFKDNILLNLAYLDGRVKTKQDIKWDQIEAPYTFEFRLNPGETFSYHDGTLPQYSGLVDKTTNAHFNGSEGFKSDGYLMGDGVCHLASLINWSARDAGLLVSSPTSHNFANIPQVPSEYGVSIYSYSGNQNLYITNTFNKPVAFRFQYIDGQLTNSVFEIN